jgi:glucose/arabinose dehydrogenase
MRKTFGTADAAPERKSTRSRLSGLPLAPRLLMTSFAFLAVLFGTLSIYPDTGNAQGATATPTAAPAPTQAPRLFDASHIKLPDGYAIEVVVSNLSVPTTAIFDGNDLLVAESGWVNTALPRILRIKPDWSVSVIASAGLQDPVTGLLVKDGKLYVSHRGKVSTVEADGTLHDIVTGLPSSGDHQNDNIVLGPDGKIYMGQGTVTNSAVIGVDNYIFGWLQDHPEAHDVPCKDVTLVGQNFESENPLTQDPNDKVTTGAYKPFGTPSTAGEVIKGDPKCGGSIARFNPDGSGYEMVAWGLRNPFGLEFDKSGQLWATYHGADVRGSRNIYNDPDYLVKVEQGAWYGWPEYFDGLPVTDSRFKDPTKEQPQFLWKDHPPLAKAFATFRSHSGINGLAFSPGGAFGFEGDAFAAAFGTFLPVASGTNADPAGFRVIRVGTKDGKVEDFALNQLPGPAYINQQGGFDRPSDLVFGPDQSLYIVDWGASNLGAEGLKLTPGTGSIWRIYPKSSKPLRPNGALVVPPAPEIPESQRKAEVRNVPEGYKMIAPQLIIAGVVLVLVIALGIFLWRRRKAA